MSQTTNEEDLTMGNKRKSNSPQFKAKVALAAIQNEETAAQLGSRFGVHPTMISTWKRQMLDGAADIFDKNHRSRKQADTQTAELYRQIGQLKVLSWRISNTLDNAFCIDGQRE